MAYEYSDLITDIGHWSQQSTKAGWIDQQQALSLVMEPENSANELFSNSKERPLIVAFLGGTGVGKSSLLNKLAGQTIARAGVERPTSREVTLYHHQSISLQQLDETFPLQDIQIARHDKEANKHIVWIDMPDFDSTEEKNKDIVMQWLPFVDVLLYVVSPERYRDNKAWQLLLAEGANHAWLFIMNQWDRGLPSQYEDFKQQLTKAGFENPIIYKTICHSESAEEADEVPQLQANIESLAMAKTVEHLEIRGLQQRKNIMKHKLQQCLLSLGNDQNHIEMAEIQEQRWSQSKEQLTQGFEWPIKQLSIIYAKKGKTIVQDKIRLWDEWAQSRFNDYLDELILTADQLGLPSTPLRKNLTDCRQQVEKYIHTQAELGCRKALINPGNIVHRAALGLVKVCEVLLPLVAMGVVGFEVFQGFYDSALTDQAFLGVDFAVHSLLLILLSWLIPYFIRKKMQPSLEKAALKGLNQGLETAMTMIEMDIQEAINTYKDQHHKVTESLKKIIGHCEVGNESKASDLESEQLKRMLIQ